MALIGYLTIISGIFFGEMWIKNRIEESGTDAKGNVMKQRTEGEAPEPRTYRNGRILIRKYHNKGAMLNLGERRRPVVAAVSVALSAVMAAVFVCSLGQRGNRLLRLGLSLLLGGAFSSTYDRLKRRYVVDYLTFNVRWKPLRRVVFNLSDFCILIGALLAVISVPDDVL